jgi:proton glutamate symport protein
MKFDKIALHWQILAALIAAIPFGFFFREYVPYISWLGEIFLRGLKMVVIPLVFFSMISGVTNIGATGNLGKIGLKTMVYYISTLLLAATTGLILVNIFKPGIGADLGFTQVLNELDKTHHNFKDILIGIIPENIIAELAKGNTLAVIFFGIIFGVFINKLKERQRTLLTDFFNGGFDVIMGITQFIIRFAPLGIFGIVAYQVASQKDILSVGLRLGQYMLVVIGGLFIHALITLPVIMYFIGRINPLKQFRGVSNALITAFSTASSNASLPVAMQCVEEKCGVSKKISSFTLPLGATINMNGTALYEIVVAMFIAQAYGIHLNLGQQIIAALCATLAAIGAAGIPMAGLVTISIVLSAIGLPLEGIGLILAVDRPLDMLRTTVNVWADTAVASIIAKSEGEELKV